MSVSEIAKALGRSYLAVAERRRKLTHGKRDTAEQRLEYLTTHQRESLESASNNYKHWTGPELELLNREDLTAVELSQMLNRTLYSVRKMRAKLQRDPRKQSLLGAIQHSNTKEYTL